MHHLSQLDQLKLIAQLKRHEGTKRDAKGLHIAYRCAAGAITIGYGHNLDANPLPGITAASKLTDEQAHSLLVTDIAKFVGELDKRLPFVKSLNAPRYAVMLNMAYNLGISGLIKFQNTIDMVEKGQYADAGTNMLVSKWATQVGKRALELAKQMTTGEWQ